MKFKNAVIAVFGFVLSGCFSHAPLLLKTSLEPLPFAPQADWRINDYQQLLSKELFSINQYAAMQHYIEQVVNNNLDLKSISKTVKAASYNAVISKAEAWPRADVNVSQMRDKREGDVRNTFSLNADVSWKLDVWKKRSDDVLAAQYLSDKARYELQQFKRVLVRQSAGLWVEYRGYVHVEKHLIHLNKIQKNLLDYYQDAYQAGLAPYEFYLDAKNRHKESESRLQAIQLDKLKTLQLMNILRGRLPTEDLFVNDDYVVFNLVALKGDIPATILANRPDIQAAFSEVNAFNRIANSAHKALLPQVSLTASLSKNGTTLEKLLRGDLVWQFIGGLTQPLFNGGQLRAIARQKTAEAESAWWQYQNRVLNAILEVENALANDNLLAWQLAQKQKVLHNLRHKISSAEERFRYGDLAFSDYLFIKAEGLGVQIDLSDLTILYIKNRLNLMTALGLSLEGRYENNGKQS